MRIYYLPLVVEFPVCRIHQKVTLEWYRAVTGCMRPYKGVRVWIFISLLLSSHVREWQSRGSAADDGDDVMAEAD
jgi:hypothetical protein